MVANPLYEEGCPQGGVCRDANNRSTKLIVKTENRASKIWKLPIPPLLKLPAARFSVARFQDALLV
jgi:hypothetical protein